MARRKDPFDVDGWLNQAEPITALPIKDRFQPEPIRPFGNPDYLAPFLSGAVEVPVQGSLLPAYEFDCPVCKGQATVAFGFRPEGPFDLECAGKCKPGELRSALRDLVPLAFELRDDILYAIPETFRDGILKAGLEGERLLHEPELQSALRSMRRKGGTTSVADYTGPDGQTVLLIFRQDFGNGQKSFSPVNCYADASDRLHLKNRYPCGLLPLFNWSGMTNRPDATVMLVEGEQTAMAAQELFPDMVATTSACGSGNAALSDWSPLLGKDVVIWRDNDAAGVKYEKAAAAHCMLAGAASVRTVVLPPGLPPGWDLADPLPDGLKAADLAAAVSAAVQVSWDEVKDGLPSARNRSDQPPFRLPDGLFAHHKLMRAAVEDALKHLDPGCNRGRWQGVVSAVHHALGDSGYELADDWSRREAERHGKYREGEVRRIYESYDAAPPPLPMPLLYLFRMAMKESRALGGAGWSPPDAALAMAHVAEFESRHRKITQGDNITIGIQHKRPDGSYEIRQMKEKNAESLYLSKKAPDFEGNRVGIFSLWQHNQIVEPVELVFKPDGIVGPRELNLFRGFNVQPVAGTGSCVLLKEHIAYIARVNGDETGFLWKLFAYRIQKPGEFVPCALIFIGPEGGGKTTITGAIAKLTAPYSLTLSDPEKFVGRNNACLNGKLFVQLEEMILGRNENYDSRLKHYVTSDTLDVEEKYKAQWIVPNHLFIAMTANKKSVIRITEHSRRFAVYEVPDRFRGNQAKRAEFFGKLWAELESGGLEALAYELMHVDLAGFSPAEVPKTPLFLELAGLDADSDPLRSWWRELLEKGELVGDSRQNLPWETPYSKDWLYQRYSGWCEANGTRARQSVLSKAEWAKGLGRMLPGGLPAKRMMREGKREHFLELPSYEACCSFFEDRFDCELDRSPEPAQLLSVM